MSSVKYSLLALLHLPKIVGWSEQQNEKVPVKLVFFLYTFNNQ